MVGQIKVLEYKENEDGTATVDFEFDEQAQKYLFDIGMQMLMLCACYKMNPDEIIEKITEVLDAPNS